MFPAVRAGQSREGIAMPKERIQSHTAPEFDVTVAWGRDTTVQICTTAADADERLRAWVEQVEGIQSQPGASFAMFDGWHVDLNRQQVNDLIRTLRRARDQAFGRDE